VLAGRSHSTNQATPNASIHIQAEITGGAVNARTWEPVLSPAESKFVKAMEHHQSSQGAALYYKHKKMGTQNEFCERINTKSKMEDSGPTRLDHRHVWCRGCFLNADIGHCQFIYVPEAMIKTGMMEEEESKVSKSMYGNVDAALSFFIKYKRILKDLGMIQCETDPCVFYRVNIQGYLDLVMACHVDVSIIEGWKPVIDEYLKDFEKHLKIERLGRMKNHLGIWWAWKEDDRGV
jgi:hypothetical protein